MIELTDLQKIGLGLVGFGSLFLTIGVFLFLDKVLLALGNILFLCGLCLLIGVGRTLNFFWQPHNPIKMKVSLTGRNRQQCSKFKITFYGFLAWILGNFGIFRWYRYCYDWMATNWNACWVLWFFRFVFRFFTCNYLVRTQNTCHWISSQSPSYQVKHDHLVVLLSFKKISLVLSCRNTKLIQWYS